jgi:hypothetical protein
MNVGGVLGQARTLRSIGLVQFDLVVIHSVQKFPDCTNSAGAMIVP